MAIRFFDNLLPGGEESVKESLRELFVLFILPIITADRRLWRYFAAFVNVPFCRSSDLSTVVVDNFHEVTIWITMERLEHALAPHFATFGCGMLGEDGVYILMVMGKGQRDDYEDAGNIFCSTGLYFKGRHVWH